MEIENLPVPTMHGYTPEEMKVAVANFERRQELARLEREVIEAAKAWRKRKSQLSEGRLFNAVCDLESHEAKQK